MDRCTLILLPKDHFKAPQIKYNGATVSTGYSETPLDYQRPVGLA